MYQAKSGVKSFTVTWGGGGPATKKFFSQSEHVSSQIWCQKIFPLLGGGSLEKNFFPSLNMYQAKSGVKNFSLYWDQIPPPQNLRPGTPPPENLRPGTPPKNLRLGTSPENLRPGTPPPKIWNLGHPPKEWTDTQTGVKTLPSLVLRTRAVIKAKEQISKRKLTQCDLHMIWKERLLYDVFT